MMVKVRIRSEVKPLRDEDFHWVSLHSKRQRKVRADTGKRGAESIFVHFRQLFQKGAMKALSLGTTGKDGHMARASGDAGRGDAFSTFALFMPRYGEGHDFRESRNVHFRQPGREQHVYPWGLTRLP